MKIIVLGSDGYLGWPTSIDLFDGHELCLIDNYIKKNLMKNNKRKPLVQNKKIENIVKILKQNNKNIFSKI